MPSEVSYDVGAPPTDAQLRRRLAMVYLTVFIDIMAFGIIVPQLPFFLVSLGGTPFQMGVLVAANPAGGIIGGPVLGYLGDRLGRKPVILLSVMGTGLGCATLGVAGMLNSYWLLLLGRAFSGFCGAAMGVAQALVADMTMQVPEKRAKYMSYTGMFAGLGFILGPVLGGVFENFAVATFLAGGAGLLNGILGFFFIKETNAATLKKKAAAAAEVAAALADEQDVHDGLDAPPPALTTDDDVGEAASTISLSSSSGDEDGLGGGAGSKTRAHTPAAPTTVAKPVPFLVALRGAVSTPLYRVFFSAAMMAQFAWLTSDVALPLLFASDGDSTALDAPVPPRGAPASSDSPSSPPSPPPPAPPPLSSGGGGGGGGGGESLYPKWVLGALMGYLGLLFAISQPLSALYKKRVTYEQRVYMTGAVLLCVGMVITPIGLALSLGPGGSLAIIVVGQTFAVLGFGSMMPMGPALLSHNAPADQIGSVMGVSQAFQQFSRVAAPLLIGALYGLTPVAPFIMSGACAIVAGLLIFLKVPLSASPSSPEALAARAAAQEAKDEEVSLAVAAGQDTADGAALISAVAGDDTDDDDVGAVLLDSSSTSSGSLSSSEGEA